MTNPHPSAASELAAITLTSKISEFWTDQPRVWFIRTEAMLAPQKLSDDARCTRWPEAFPLRDVNAETVAKILYTDWICRYGSPVKLTSDQGRQFESSLFRQLLKLLGIERIRTTAYHPQANGAIERFHRTLKAALMARLSTKSWVDELPTVLLGLRAASRSDTGVSAAQLTFGRTLRLPGDFYDATGVGLSEPHSLVERIRENIQSLKPVPGPHSNSRLYFVHPDLSKVEYVFVRDDSVRSPLKPPYSGPYQVLERGPKAYVIQLPDCLDFYKSLKGKESEEDVDGYGAEPDFEVELELGDDEEK
ncbi:uncharacterized protein LOC111362435 [Spodoptera litura]|uniref:Uncharacterized protein LOC111362435 n=1 Tax=Spodoptera litura TaxID=69820 RepID=A0A9J7J2T2_SPOLT|nr:uncharacterized protein LOC111362435 [Spodoptera litura]